MSKDKTNLASEFYVLSVLSRFEKFDAYLTLGNKKSVDIVVVKNDGASINVEVKAVAGKHDWTVGKFEAEEPDRTVVVLVSYDGDFSNSDCKPNCWILPYRDAADSVTDYQTKSGLRRNIKRKYIADNYSANLNNWSILQCA